MAEKNATKNTAPVVQNYMPEGYSDADFSEVGLLTPMYKPKNAYTEKWGPVFGWATHVQFLPKQVQKNAKTGEEEDWIPLGLNVVLCAPNKGVLGKKGAERVVDVAPGENLLVPLTGQLLYKKELMIAAFDVQRIWLARITVTGQQTSEYPSDMWTWKTELAKKPRLRKDDPTLSMIETTIPPELIGQLPPKVKKALPSSAYPHAASVPIIGQTSSGEVFDADGVLRDRIIPANASA